VVGRLKWQGNGASIEVHHGKLEAMLTHAAPSLIRLHAVERSDRVSTYAEVAALVDQCRSAVAAEGVEVKPNSALGSLFAKAGRLNMAWTAGTAAEEISTLIEADEAYRIAEAVVACIKEAGAREAVRRITKSDMRRSFRQPSQGKDALWELSLIAFLRGCGVPVAFKDPPDLEIALGGSVGGYGVACKKVYSLDSVEKQFSKGLKQLAPYRGWGLVAFNLDDLIDERSSLVAATRSAAGGTLARRNQAFIERNRPRFQEAVMAGRCDGIWVSSCAHYDIAEMSPRFNRVTENTLWTVTEAGMGTKVRLDAIRRLVERG
jgi:hypothetical protein